MKTRISVALVTGLLLTMSIACGGGSQPAPANGGAAEAPPPEPVAEAPAPEAPRPLTGEPVLVVETVKGTFEIKMYPADEPKTVEHVVALARRNFYNGLRVHRVEPGFVVQFGDPQTRDMTKRDRWGTGGSGQPIGVNEYSPKHRHVAGAVAMAHPGDPKLADSQMYIMLGSAPRLDGDFTVFGNVTSGMDVVRKLEETDVIRRVTVKDGA